MTRIQQSRTWPLPPWPLPSFAGYVSDALCNGRSLLGWSRSKLAHELGVGRQTVERWETIAVADEIALASVHRAVVALLIAERPTSARMRDRERTRARSRANLLAWSLMFGHSTLLTEREWLELLSAAPRLLAGVPRQVTRARIRYITGENVGIALAAAARGTTYSNLAAAPHRERKERSRIRIEAVRRLEYELRRVWAIDERLGR